MAVNVTLLSTTVVPLLQLIANATSEIEDAEEISAYKGFMEVSRFWIQRVLVPFVVLVGVLGNLATTVVLTRRRMRSSTNVYLTALAASDLLYLLFLFSLSLAHYGIKGGLADAYWTYWRFGLWLTDATSSTSIWLTVSFTLERYIAVCHPLRGKMLCTEPRARKVTALVYFLCFLSTASTPFEWQTVRVPVTHNMNITQLEDNSTLPLVTRVSVELTALGKLHSYRTLFYWFSSIMFVFLPLLLLVVFNSFLVFAVHRSQRQRRHLTQTERHGHDGSQQNAQQENKITVTLIAVCVLFLFCQSPTAIVLIYTSLSEEPAPDSDRDHIMRGLGNIFNLLVAVNAACNFILYCALSDKYRRTFAMTFLPRRCWARRDLMRATTMVTGASYAGDDSPHHRISRSPSIFKPNDGVTTEYLQVPLNGREALLKRHQSAYIQRDRQSIPNSRSPGSNSFTRTKSMIGRVDSPGRERTGLLKSPGRESSGLLDSVSSASPPTPSLLCFKLPSRKPSKKSSQQEVKITVSEAELDGLSSV